MYFPGTTLQQIEDLRKRVSALEGPKQQPSTTDQCEYQTQTYLPGEKTASGIGSVYGGSISAGIAQTAQSKTQDILKKSVPSYSVAFYSPAKSNVVVEADHFHFGSQFVVFDRLGSRVAAYVVSEISSITKL